MIGNYALYYSKKKFWNDLYLSEEDDSTWKTLSCGTPYFDNPDNGTPDNGKWMFNLST